MPEERSISRRRHAPKGPIKHHDHTDNPDHTDNQDRATNPKWLKAGRCTARAKGTGVRCKRPPIPGGTVCVKHGGGAPQVQFVAMERLVALQPASVRRIGHWIDQEEFPTVSLGACKDVLDRTLGKATETLDVKHSADEGQLLAILDAWKDAQRDG